MTDVRSKEERDFLTLRIAGVSLGKHLFSFVCDKKFFENTGITELCDGALNLEIEMEKSESLIRLLFHFKGEVIASCDRCLDPVPLFLDFSEELTVKLVAIIEEETEDENIWIVPENEYALDLFHFVYETIRLALPMQIIHPDNEDGTSTCNAKVLEQLKSFSVKESAIDPRWEALKNIKTD